MKKQIMVTMLGTMFLTAAVQANEGRVAPTQSEKASTISDKISTVYNKTRTFLTPSKTKIGWFVLGVISLAVYRKVLEMYEKEANDETNNTF